MKEEKSVLGSIKIHKAVIAEIAAEAIRGIEGVSGLASNLKGDFFKLIGKSDIPGINVDMSNEKVKLEVFVIVKFGVDIPEIANKVQENVKSAVEKMTNLSILDINVNVQGVEGGK